MPTQAPDLWVSTASAISQEELAGMASPQPTRMQGSFSRAAAAAGGLSALQRAADAAAESMAAPSMVDASLLLGHSFRAGWGPHCTFVQPCEQSFFSCICTLPILFKASYTWVWRIVSRNLASCKASLQPACSDMTLEASAACLSRLDILPPPPPLFCAEYSLMTAFLTLFRARLAHNAVAGGELIPGLPSVPSEAALLPATHKYLMRVVHISFLHGATPFLSL